MEGTLGISGTYGQAQPRERISAPECGEPEAERVALLAQSWTWLSSLDWLFNFANVHVWTRSSSSVPIVWARWLERTPLSECQARLADPGPFEASDGTPEAVINFLRTRHQLHLRFRALMGPRLTSPPVIPAALAGMSHVGLTPKKRHEILVLAALIGARCQALGLQRVIDVGSGLGYLSEVLVTHFQLQVLALEGRADYAERAGQRPSVRPGGLEVKRAFIARPEDLAQHVDASEPWALVGLHCCGDLSPTLLKAFVALPHLKLLCLVPCCYHKMSEGPRQSPLSASGLRLSQDQPRLKAVMTSVFARRLATQEPLEHWVARTPAEHQTRALQFGLRAVLERWAQSLNVRVRKRRRHCFPKSKMPTEVTPEVVRAFWSRFHFEPTDSEPAGALTEEHFLQAVREHEGHFQWLGKLTGLQLALQYVLESAILNDFLLYLRENSIPNSQLLPIFQESLSPRHNALMAAK